MWWNSSQDEFTITLRYTGLILNETKLVYKRVIKKKSGRRRRRKERNIIKILSMQTRI